MHTVTSKLILTPLAEAVFQLILIISDSDINETAIPDLSQLAKVVDGQIVNLVAIGTKIQNQPSADDKLKREMPEACEMVSSASMRLVKGTTLLSNEPLSKQGKAELLESAKGILAGTTNVLYAFDNYEIRKVVHSARACSQKAQMIKSTGSTGFQPQQMVQWLMQTSQMIVQLAQLTNKRISELLSPVLRQRLKKAVDELTRESPLLITSSKALMQSPSNPHLIKSRDYSCDRLRDICMEIEIVVQIVVEDERQGSYGAEATELIADFQSIMTQNRALAQKMQVCFDEGEFEGMQKFLDEYLKGCDNLRKKTLEFIEKVKDRKAKTVLQDLMALQNAQIATTEKLGKAVEEDHNNMAKKQDLIQSMQKSNAIWSDVAEKKVRVSFSLIFKIEYENSFANLLNQNDGFGRNIIRSFNDMDVSSAKEAQEAYLGSSKKLKQRSLEYMDSNRDPLVRKEIQQLLDTLESDEEKIRKTSGELEKAPENKAQISDLASKLATSSKNWAAIDAANSTGKNKIFDHLRDESKNIGEELITAIKDNKKDEAQKIYSQFVPVSKKLTDHALELKSEASDPKTRQKIGDILSLQNTLGDVINKLASESIADPDKVGKLENSLEKHYTNWGKIQNYAGGNIDTVFAALTDASAKNGHDMIIALRENDSPAAQGAYDDFKDDNKLLRARAIEFIEKASNPVVKSKLENILKRYDQVQDGITTIAPKLIMNPSDESGIINELEELLEDNDMLLAEIAENNEQGYSPLSKLREKLAETEEKFFNAVDAGDLYSAATFLDTYKRNARHFKQKAQILCGSLPSPTLKEAILDGLDSLETLECQLFDFIDEQKILHEPASERLKISKLSEILSAADKARSKIDSDLKKALVFKIADLLDQLADHSQSETLFGAMFASASNGDRKSLPQKVDDFKGGSGQLSNVIETLKEMSEGSGEEQVAAKLTLLSQRLAQLEPSTITAYEAVAFDPSDSGAKEFSKGMTNMWEENIKDIWYLVIGQEGIFNAPEIAEGLKNAYDRRAKALEKAIDSKKAPESVNEAKGVVSAGFAFLEFAKKEIENSEDRSYKADLQQKVNEVQNYIPNLVSKVSNMASKWNATKAWPQAEADSLLSTTSDISKGIVDMNSIIRDHHGFEEFHVPVVEAYSPPVTESWKEEVEEQEPVETIAEEEEPPEPEIEDKDHEIVYTEEEAPKLLTEFEAQESPLQAVAQELKVEASKWDNENPIISAVEKIGSCFERLSYHHNELKVKSTPEAKKGFIEAAKDIVKFTNALIVPATTVAEGCTDNRLKRNLQGTLDRLSTLSQQLKIVAAVKAAAPSDTDRDAQLIAIAQNLMAAIKGCVKECDTVSIKQRAVALNFKVGQTDGKVPAPKAATGMMFKKKVYRVPVSSGYRTSNQMVKRALSVKH